MKILVSCFVVIFLEICYGCNDCSLGNGGLMIESITEPLKSPVNPHWSGDYKRLYFADEDTSKGYMYDPEKEDIKEFVPNEDQFGRKNFFLFNSMNKEVYLWNIITEKSLTVKQGRTDNKKRLFLGTEPDEDDSQSSSDLIKLNGTNPLVPVLSKGISSQVSFNSDYSKILIVDEVYQQISIADYGGENGTVDQDSLHTVYEASNSEKIADAIFDNKDNIWIAFSKSGKIVKYNYKSKKNECEMTMPVKSISGMTWGGAKWDKLYVTTRQGDDPASGSVYSVSKLDGVGVPYTDY